MRRDETSLDPNSSVPTLQEIQLGLAPARWYSSTNEKSVEQTTHEDSKQTRNVYSFVSPSSRIGAYSTVSKPNGEINAGDDANSLLECGLCPKRCRISSGKVGYCSARINVDGRLYSRFYGRPTSVAIDPIEKKPLFHFLPGSSVLSLGTQGCTLSCKFCQNWQISRPLPLGQDLRNILLPQQVVSLAQEHRCPSVAFTYNEPTIWSEYVIDVARLCKKANIKTVLVTNGLISGDARKDVYGVVDAANVDLKSFRPEFYQNLCNGSLDGVKETLRYIVKETNVWLEITNLLIPTHNDSPSEIKELCDWVANELGVETPLHFSAFFPTYRLTNVPPTPPQTLFTAYEIAKEAGLKYAYCGNIKNESTQTTYCPRCGRALIERHGRQGQATDNFTKDSCGNNGHCRQCNEKIAGIF